MDPQAILDQARQSGDPPRGWTVIPLNRPAVLWALAGWLSSAFVGVGLFVWLLAAVWGGVSIFHLFFLALLGFVGVGSLYLAGKKTLQYLNADRYLIVLTPEQFVQQTGSRVTSLAMTDIGHITLRGVFGGDLNHVPYSDRDAGGAVLTMNRMLGGQQGRRTRRTPDSLAFVDMRTDAVIEIAQDNSFTDLPVLEELLRSYVDAIRPAFKQN